MASTSTYMLGCSQFGKLKRCKTIGVEDWISGLPDEILSNILNRLTLKEAIATGILCKRWKNLWVSLPNLDLGCVPRSYSITYVQIVDKILQQHNAPKLHKLRIVCPLLDSYREHIDDWISFAITKGVSELELNLDLFSLFCRLINYYVRAHVFSGGGMTNPNTVHCASLHTPLRNAGKHFESLTHLCLGYVNLSDEVFDLILSNCFSLERFILMFTLRIVNAKSTTPHLKLKSLELYFCKDLEYLQLSAPNLMSFKYQGTQRTLCIKDAKHLASLSLVIFTASDPNTSSIVPRGKSFIFSQFSSYIPKLESLVVSANLFEDMIDFTELNAFSNLKQLKLDVVSPCWIQRSYQVAASIMREAPFLELIEMILPTMSRSRLNCEALELTSMPPHLNFKGVKLFGFRGDDNTMEFLAYLVEYADSLQKIDITAFGAILIGHKLKVQPRLNWNGDDAEHSKNCVLQLRQTLHSNVQLVFHDG